METKLCPFCAEEIKQEAIKCKHCGSGVAPASVQPPGNSSVNSPRTTYEGTLWLPIPSLVLGVFSVLILFDDSGWDIDLVIGLLLFSGTGLTLGIVGTAIQTKGKGMSIAGIVLSAIGALAGLGLLLTI